MWHSDFMQASWQPCMPQMSTADARQKPHTDQNRYRVSLTHTSCQSRLGKNRYVGNTVGSDTDGAEHLQLSVKSIINGYNQQPLTRSGLECVLLF